MVATTTAFKNLLKHLKNSFSELTFRGGDGFRWSPSETTVWYSETEENSRITLLHETAHGLLGHTSYDFDIDLLKLEREAWNKALNLGETYGVSIDKEYIENALDSYRDWLHARSICPACQQNGVQSDSSSYRCLICDQKWHVNDARNCGLKRRKTS